MAIARVEQPQLIIQNLNGLLKKETNYVMIFYVRGNCFASGIKTKLFQVRSAPKSPRAGARLYLLRR